MFESITRKKAKLRMALTGVSGAGKTLSALYVAYGITGDWKKIALIDAAREWSLEGRPKKQTEKQEKDEVQIKSCPECFKIFPLKDKNGNIHQFCPFCGYVFPKQSRDVKEEKQVILQKIEKFVLSYDSPEQCGSYQEFLCYAKRKGYKPGWAYYQARNRGMI